jgi:hypothetical protein
MFNNCSNLTSFNLESNDTLQNLETGTRMFKGCAKMTHFYAQLSSLKNGEEMFYGCNSLPTFTNTLPELENAREMFRDCTRLQTCEI